MQTLYLGAHELYTSGYIALLPRNCVLHRLVSLSGMQHAESWEGKKHA